MTDLEKSRSVRPTRWYEYILEKHYKSQREGTLFEGFVPVIPFAVVDGRITDLAIHSRYHHSRLKQRALVTNVELGGRHQRSRNTTMLRNIFFSAQAGRRAPAIGRA
jgi:hypothetical protein